MPYHIGRNNQLLGQFTETEIREGLQRGAFFPSDLAWQAGMPGWQPLHQVFSFAAVPSLTAPAAVLDPASGYAPPAPYGYGSFSVPAPPTSGVAIASLILGVVALSMFGACFIGLVFSIPGVVCGHIALNHIKCSNGQLQGYALAITGLVLSYTATVLMLAFILFFGLMMAVSAATGG